LNVDECWKVGYEDGRKERLYQNGTLISEIRWKYDKKEEGIERVESSYLCASGLN